MAFSEKESVAANSFFVSDPLISTGAGDNFNAGFIAAQVMNLDAESSLIFANAVAGLYIQSGKSATINDVIHFLENKNKTEIQCN
jgi:sugar/nucleoside kinase (ribokinase family)